MTLRNGKAAGPDEIPAEAIKADTETAVNMLHSLFSKIWEKEECTYKDMSCRIAHAGQLSESFEVKTGVRQGCLLSPFLFLLVIDWIMKTTTTGRKNGIQWTLLDAAG
nr:hypothetical protein BaRGS_032455 [Batillaria attramentaria]